MANSGGKAPDKHCSVCPFIMRSIPKFFEFWNFFLLKRNINTKDASEMGTVKNWEGKRLNFMVLSGFDEVKMKWGDYGFIFSMQVFSILNVPW